MKTLFVLLISLAISFSSLCQASADMDSLVKRKWLRVQTKDFDILTDLDQKKAVVLISDLEAYRYFHINVLGMKLVAESDPLTVMAISSSSTFKALDMPDTLAGLFKFGGTDSLAIANVAKYSDNLKKPSLGRHVLLHEYLHYMSRYSVVKRSFPLWFEEGKAEYYATFKFDGKNIYIGNPQAIMMRSLGLFNRAGNLEINSKEIFETKSLPLFSERLADRPILDRFYSRSFFIVHYLYSTMPLRQSMAKYLSLVASGKTEEESMKMAFNQTFEEFDKDVIEYVKGSLQMRVLSAKEGNFMFPEINPKIQSLTKDEARGRLTHFVRGMGLE